MLLHHRNIILTVDFTLHGRHIRANLTSEPDTSSGKYRSHATNLKLLRSSLYNGISTVFILKLAHAWGGFHILNKSSCCLFRS